jgi:mannosyltransferase
VAWLRLWRRGRVPGRDGAWLAAAVGALYAPWLPSVVFQAAHTGAPWAQRPSPLLLLAVPGALFGYVAYGALVVALARERALRRVGEPVRVLALVAATTAAAAWAFSQVDPAWSTRYLAVLFGPVLLALAAVLARGSRWTVAALLCVAVAWLLGGPAAGKSNVRRVAAHVSPDVRAGDLVVSTQPEQVPVLDRYLPGGLTYVTPLGAVTDPRVVDWRDGLPRLRHGRADRVLLPWVDGLPAGRRVLLVTPVFAHGKARAPWLRAVRARTREWRAALHADPRLHEIATVARAALPRRRSTVRAELFEVSAGSAAVDAAGLPVGDHRQR